MNVSWPYPKTILMVAVSAISYVWIVWRPGWNWWLFSTIIAAILAALLALWGVELNREAVLRGLLPSALATMIGLGAAFGLAMQALSNWWLGTWSLALQVWGLLGLLSAITVVAVVYG